MKRRLLRLSAPGAALLAVALVAAGGGFSTGASATPAFTPVVIQPSQGLNLGEPGITVASDGSALYVNAPTGISSPSKVFKSTNGGTTWVDTPQSGRANLPGGGDSNVAADPAVPKTLYMTDLWLGSATVSVTKDGANTWTANPVQGVVVQDRQWIATPGGGIAYHLTHQIPSGLVVSKSIDGGLTYPQHTVAATPADQTGCVCPPGTLIAEGGSILGGGKVGFVYSTSTGGVNFAFSTNGGLTFTNVPVRASNSGQDTGRAFPVVANAGGNHLVAVWQEVSSDGTSWSQIGFSESTNWGQTWSAPTYIVDKTSGSLYPWVDAKGSKVAVSLYHTATPGVSDTAPAGTQWFESYLERVSGVWSGLVTVDPTAVKTGPICTGGINCSGNRELLDFQSVALDPGGAANVTWTHSIDNVSTTELRFAHES
jgi:hypothetical protein